MRRTEAVASEQMELPNMPEPIFDANGYSVADIANAQRKVDETMALIDAHPELMGEAAQMAADEAAQRGHVGVRWLGEALRLRLHDDGTDGYSNDCVGVIARMLCADEPWLRGFFDLRPCALDCVMGGTA